MADYSKSTALVRKRVEMELMPPPPPPKRIKRPKIVIDEDLYTDGLSKIIARDFFPGLLESETQQEYLDALDSKDQAWISSASRRLQHVMTPGRKRAPATPRAPLAPGSQTPRGFAGDTPATVVSTTSVAPSVQDDPSKTVDTNLSLAAFQAKYTSEDNESFYKLLDKQNHKRAEKYAWLWNGNQLPSKRQIKQKEVENKLREQRGTLIDDGYGKRDQLAIRDKDDDRPAAPETWKVAPRNALMFGPESADSDENFETVAMRAQAASRAEPKSIVYANTRVPDPNATTVAASTSPAGVPPSPSLTAVRDAIAGRPRDADLDSNARVGGDETPRVNGYAFVDDEEPDEEAVPAPAVIKLGSGDATPNPFNLKERGRREALHHRMVDRIAESKRTSARMGFTGKVELTPTPRYPHSPRVGSGNLTPAAQRLWSKIGGAESRGGSLGSSSLAGTPARGRATPKPRIPGIKRTPR